MKVLILNGSPRVGGNTTVAVEEMERIFREEGVEVETVAGGHTGFIRGALPAQVRRDRPVRLVTS